MPHHVLLDRNGVVFNFHGQSLLHPFLLNKVQHLNNELTWTENNNTKHIKVYRKGQVQKNIYYLTKEM